MFTPKQYVKKLLYKLLKLLRLTGNIKHLVLRFVQNIFRKNLSFGSVFSSEIIQSHNVS